MAAPCGQQRQESGGAKLCVYARERVAFRTEENVVTLVRLLGAWNLCHVPPATFALGPLNLDCLDTTHVPIAVIDELLREDAVNTRVLAYARGKQPCQGEKVCAQCLQMSDCRRGKMRTHR